MKLAVIGSRGFNDYELLKLHLNNVIQNNRVTHIVSGGALGADSLAERFAKENNIETLIFLPDWKTHGKAAGFIRNKDIVSNADMVVAFWDGKSKGTKHSIDLANKSKTPLLIVETSNNLGLFDMF
jgi:hypothetical protein